MPDFKVVLQYSEAGKGFQEVFYRNASNIQAASTFDLDFRYAATSFRNPLTVLKKARVSEVTNNRNTAVINLNTSSTYNPGNPAVTGLAAVFNLNGLAPGGTRRIWLRGLTAVDIVRSQTTGDDQISSNLDLHTSYYFRKLQSLNFTIQFLTPTGTAPNIYQRITTLDGTAGAGVVRLTYVGTSPPVLGKLVKITQVSPKDWPGLNGLFKVLALAGQTFDIAYNLHTTAVGAEVKTGRWRPANYLYGVIDSSRCEFGNFSTRITGKSPLGGRGRRTGTRLRLV